MTAIPVLTVRGTPPAMGAAYGQAMAELIAGNVELYRRRFCDDAGLSGGDVLHWGALYRRVAAGYQPRIQAMLDGLAEGAGLPVEEVYALNARTELLYGSGHRRDEGCTALAVLPERTADGHTLLAQNWDWRPEQGPVTFLLATVDETGHTVLCLTEAGMLAKSGLNSAGLGVCANLLTCDRDRGGEGVPYHLLLRGVLEARTMSGAIRAAVDCERISSGNLLLADAGGQAIDLEVAPGDFGHLLPDGGLLTHANHFESGIGVLDIGKARSASTLLRPVRARRLLAEPLAERRVSVADIETTLRDHYSDPDGICRHPDPGLPETERVCSVYSLVMDLDARVLRVAPHPVCGHSPAVLALSELADREGKDTVESARA
ncbi:MAG: C45 family autoproteolytic acyltransferase/hydrolase [Carbonactinosporaceae bacterium]